MTDRTFTIIKPNAVSAGNTGKILDIIIGNGYRIIGMRMVRMDRGQASRFYGIHKDKEFFNELIEFMTSGPVVVAVLEKEDAVASFRRLIGNTDPAEATEGTIRKMFGETLRRNAIHASDSDDNAALEAGYFFSEFDLVEY